MTIQENFSLKAFNTFGIDARARHFAAFRSPEELQELLLRDSNGMVLGGGSNVLFTRDVDGLVMKNELYGIHIIHEDDQHVYVKAGAGESWHGLVLYCLNHNLAGIENLALIPGSVGASPMQNIGAYGVEIKDVLHSLEAFHKLDKTFVQFSNNDCAFAYRESVFKNRYRNQFVICNVIFRLNKRAVLHTTYGAIEAELERMQVQEISIQAIAAAVTNIRKSKLPDPAVTGNAGSFFKNPEIPAEQFETLKEAHPGIIGYALEDGDVKLAAGWLIEQCGWKGYRKGDAGCHEKQALVLVNYGRASGEEILDLSDAIIASVKDKFGVSLSKEVNIIG